MQLPWIGSQPQHLHNRYCNGNYIQLWCQTLVSPLWLGKKLGMYVHFCAFSFITFFFPFYLGCNLPKLAMCTQGMKSFFFFSCRIADNATWASSCLRDSVHAGCLVTVTGSHSRMTVVPFRSQGPFGPWPF